MRTNRRRYFAGLVALATLEIASAGCGGDKKRVGTPGTTTLPASADGVSATNAPPLDGANSADAADLGPANTLGVDSGTPPGDAAERAAAEAKAATNGGTGETGAKPVVSADEQKRRDQMTAFLLPLAEKAMKSRDYARAIPLYGGVVAVRGAHSGEAVTLARAWTLAGQYEQAIEVLEEYIAASSDGDAVRAAEAERDRLRKSRNPFAGRFSLKPAIKEAKTVFKKGRASFKKKNYEDARWYFEMGAAMAPDLPGFLRELGATYDKLGISDKKIEFYRAYLQRRPFSKNSVEIRKELESIPNALGTLAVETSIECEEMWVNGQRMPKNKLSTSISMPPGRYKALCYAPKYGIAYFEYAALEAGKTAKLQFRWAIMVNKLVDPYGRIAVEDARSPGVLVDLGIDKTAVGVIVPDDGRALKMVLKDDSGTRVEERFIKLQPGAREVVTW